MISRKCIALFIAFLLLVSNTGLAFNVHFCGGQISAITSVYNKSKVCQMPAPVAEKKCCAKKLAVSHKKCCSDKELNLKGKTGDVIVKAISLQAEMPMVFPTQVGFAFSEIATFHNRSASTYYCDAHAPPLFKLYCRYIYYA
jgi:hypothetical protein